MPRGSILQRTSSGNSPGGSVDLAALGAADVTLVAGVAQSLLTLGPFTTYSSGTYVIEGNISGELQGVAILSAIIRIDTVDTVGASATNLVGAAQSKQNTFVRWKGVLAAGAHTIILRGLSEVGATVVNGVTDALHSSYSLTIREVRA